jgi:hypothetical protein
LQQSADLAYLLLLLLNPEFRTCARKKHFMKCKRIRLRENIGPRVASGAQIGPDHVFYPGDGSSAVHLMLHSNGRGYTIAAYEAKHVSEVAKPTVISTSALAVLAPIRKDIVGWDRLRTRHFCESYDVMIQAGDRSALTGSR